MNTARALRSQRIAAEIPATLLAAKAKVNRCRLSNIERGYVLPTAQELERLQTALEELIEAKAAVDLVAASVGWLLGARRD
jgi:transcriptional regulator with XRE-family HTH domain